MATGDRAESSGEPQIVSDCEQSNRTMSPLERLSRYRLRSHCGQLVADRSLRTIESSIPASGEAPVVLSQDSVERGHCVVDATLDVAITGELGDLTQFRCPIVEPFRTCRQCRAGRTPKPGLGLSPVPQATPPCILRTVITRIPSAFSRAQIAVPFGQSIGWIRLIAEFDCQT